MLKVKSDSVQNRSYHFSLLVIHFISRLPKGNPYWVLGDQLLRSGTSIGANIFEAKSSSSRKEFIRYYEIALKSANETNYWLGLLKDSSFIPASKILPLSEACTELSKIVASSILTLKSK